MRELSNIFCRQTDSIVFVLSLFEKAGEFNLPVGIALVVDESGLLLGTVTEGDVRRALLDGKSFSTCVIEIMNIDPITFSDKLSLKEIFDKIPDELSKRNRRSSHFLGKIIVVDDYGAPKRVLNYHELWEQKVATHRHLVVLGLGYVGLTLALAMADVGFHVTGVDVDESKVASLSKGDCYIHEVGLNGLLNKHIHKKLFVTTQIPDYGDVYVISVGTPVDGFGHQRKSPIMDFLKEACEKIALKLKRGDLVILRSTVPIGTCRNFVKLILENSSGLECGFDFHLSFAPERTSEGNALKELRTLPQIIGGYNKDSVEATAAVFSDLTPTIIKVESMEAAELAKLINNSFRDYVFAFSNKLAKIASIYNINVVDVINAANKEYPRNPVPLPSPGVGGPCLTKDPHIFASIADSFDIDTDIFLKGREINESMHQMVFDSVKKELILNGKDLADCTLLLCGLAFKGYPETGDLRNSSSIEIAKLFIGKAKTVLGYDYVATDEEIQQYGITPVELPTGFSGVDCVLFLNNHRNFEKINVKQMTNIMNNYPVIFDGWNLFRPEDILSSNPCTYLGLSFSRSSVNRI